MLRRIGEAPLGWSGCLLSAAGQGSLGHVCVALPPAVENRFHRFPGNWQETDTRRGE